MPSIPDRLRADQLLSRFGYCSRSEARSWLRDGRLTSAGEPVRLVSTRLEPSQVLVDGQPVEYPDGLLVMFHKPNGYTCSHDPKDAPTIYELLPHRWAARNPPVTSIGRLDKDATGLLVLTDRGDWVHRYTSPRHKVPKLYEVEVDGMLPSNLRQLFASGTLLLPGEKEPCRPAHLEILDLHHARLELTEGRFHQVKRMFACQGYPVVRLHRTRFGRCELGSLPSGHWRPITTLDLDFLPGP